MAWVKVIHEAEAEGLLAQVYESISKPIANILKSHSLNAPVLDAHMGLYRAVMFGRSGLSRADREAVATVVSVLNHCHY